MRLEAGAASGLWRPHLTDYLGLRPACFSQIAQGPTGTATHTGLHQRTYREAQDQNTKGPDSTTSEQIPACSTNGRSKNFFPNLLFLSFLLLYSFFIFNFFPHFLVFLFLFYILIYSVLLLFKIISFFFSSLILRLFLFSSFFLSYSFFVFFSPLILLVSCLFVYFFLFFFSPFCCYCCFILFFMLFSVQSCFAFICSVSTCIQLARPASLRTKATHKQDNSNQGPNKTGGPT